MDKQIIYDLIDECRQEMQQIDEHFYGTQRIITQEKEEGMYKVQFKKLNVKPSIVSNIYSCRSDNEGIQNIKNSIENRLIEK